jgi:hypothetical protein
MITGNSEISVRIFGMYGFGWIYFEEITTNINYTPHKQSLGGI